MNDWGFTDETALYLRQVRWGRCLRTRPHAGRRRPRRGHGLCTVHIGGMSIDLLRRDRDLAHRNPSQPSAEEEGSAEEQDSRERRRDGSRAQGAASYRKDGPHAMAKERRGDIKLIS